MLRTCLSALLLIAGCGGAAVQAHGNDDTADVDAAIEAASVELLVGLTQRETQDLALTELKMLGTRAIPLLRAALAHSYVAAHEDLQAELLALLAQYGDDDARDALLDKTSTDAVVVACRLAHVDAEAQRATLIAALRHAAPRVRSTALRRLIDQPRDPQLDAELHAIAHHDPVSHVRAAAIDGIAARGVGAIDELLPLMRDRDAQVRSVAMRAAARLDCTRTQLTLAPLLAAGASSDGLAAFAALASCEARHQTAWLGQLQRALADSRVPIRAAAARHARLASSSDTPLPTWIHEVLRNDPVPAVRLSLALSLMPQQREIAAATLIVLSRKPRSMVGLQAAAWLAQQEHDSKAIDVLIDARQHGDVTLRKTALRALSTVPGRRSQLVHGMQDRDVSVRIAAAGALLASL